MVEVSPPQDDPQKPSSPHAKGPAARIQSLGRKLALSGRKFLDGVRRKMPGVLEKCKKLERKLQEKLPARHRGFFQKHRLKIYIGLVVLLVFFLIRGCAGHRKAGLSLEQVVSQQGPVQEAPVAVKGFKVGRFNFEDSLNVLGTIKGSVEFKLSFEIPGVVSSINYRPGERYEEGALLVSLKQDDILLRLKRAQAELNKAQTQAQINEEKVKEHEKLFAMGAIPKTTLDKVKLEHDSSKYEAEAARLEVKANEAMLEKSNLYAPSGGMVGELNIEEGETVTPNTLLGTHINIEYVYADFGAVERDYTKIALGQKAKVFIDAYPNKTFEGIVENIAPEIKGATRTATVRVRLENPEKILLPGMFARIRILLYSKKNTLVIPTDAIQGSEGEQFVYIFNPEKEKSEAGTAEKRPITVGYTRADYSQIDAGVTEGEVAAISGLERLENGKKVRLLETEEAEV